jgi:hypothetical protein
MSGTGTRADSARREKLTLRRKKSRQTIDTNRLWWSSFGAGTLLIILAAWVPVPYFYFVGLVFPLIVMGIYAFLGWKHTTRLDERLQFADSVYYLGFLFTLVTLALALIYLGTSSDWERVPLEELIGRFGLALATTIIGLAIRVAWVNATSDRSNAREDSELALVQAAEAFRLQLEQSSEAFKSLNDTYLDELQRAAVTSSETFQSHAESSTQALTGALNSVTEAVDGSAEAYTTKFQERMSNFALPDEWIREAISEPVTKISNSLDLVYGEIETVIESQKRLAADSDGVAEKFGQISESIEPLANISQKVSGIARAFDEVTGSLSGFLQAFDKQLSNSEQRMDRLSQAIGRLEESVSTLTAGMHSASESSKSMLQIAEVAEKHKDALEGSLSASRQAVTSLYDELLMAARSVSRKLDGE